MKKTFFSLVITVLVIFLCACSQQQQDLEEMISDDVTEVKITHFLMGQLTEWTIEDDDIAPLQTWANGLEYESVTFEEGQTPGDGDGQEAYWFELTGGDNPGFDYMICGPDDCYLIIESNWYVVNNPSDPPVEAP